MQPIEADLSGYISVGDARFAYFCNGHKVKMLVTKRGEGQFTPAILSNGNIPITEDTCIYGISETGHRVAMLFSKGQSASVGSLSDSVTIFAPIIVKSTGNADGFYNMLTNPWNKYDSILFSGGTVDILFNPKLAAIKRPDTDDVRSGTNAGETFQIETKPVADYTKEIVFNIFGEKATIKLSVFQTRGDLNTETSDLGLLTSYLRIDFDNSQDFVTIYNRVKVITKLLALLVRQNNIVFETTLKQKARVGCYTDSGICKVYFSDADACNLKWHRAIPLALIFEYIPSILELIISCKAEPLLSLLPGTNKDRKRISIHQIQDLCTALETEYKNLEPTIATERDELVAGLKATIKAVVKQYGMEHEAFDSNAQTTVSSCFQYLDYTLKDKIYYLYNLHKAIVDEVIAKYSLPPMTVEEIGKFVKVRNSKTHSGEIAWGNSAEMYWPLFALLYACFFSRAKIPEDLILKVLTRLF